MSLVRKYKVLMVEDDEIFRLALKSALKGLNNFSLIDCVQDGITALQSIRRQQPHILLLDLGLPELSGLEVAQRVTRRYPDVRIIVVTQVDDWVTAKHCLSLGVSGYLVKSATLAEFRRALQSVACGKSYIHPTIANKIVLQSSASQSSFESLSRRERQVALMIINGKTVDDIVEELSLNIKTVHSYRYNIFKKLGVENDVQVCLLAMKQGYHDA